MGGPSLGRLILLGSAVLGAWLSNSDWFNTRLLDFFTRMAQVPGCSRHGQKGWLRHCLSQAKDGNPSGVAAPSRSSGPREGISNPLPTMSGDASHTIFVTCEPGNLGVSSAARLMLEKRDTHN